MWGILKRVLTSTMSSVTMNTFEEPTVQDVLRVKSLLEQAPSSMTLPLELIDIILDYAEYWPHTTNSCQLQDLNIFGSPHGTQVEDKLLARSVPLGCPSDGRHDGELKFNTDYSTQSPALVSYSPASAIDEMLNHAADSS
jgi:hypothetical protein